MWRGVIGLRTIGACMLALTVAAPVAASTRSQQLYAKALIPFHAQRWEEAHLLLDEAASADPDDAMVAYYRGLTNARLGRTAEAINDIERALSLRPDLPGAVLDLGILYFQTGQYAQADEWLQRAYKQPSTRFSAAFFLGLTRLRQGNAEAAQALFAEAAKDPGLRSSAQYYQAVAALRAGESGEARELFNQAQTGPADAETTVVAKQYLAGGSSTAAAAPGAPGDESWWEVHGDTGFGFDSNVVLAPNSESLKNDYTTEPDGSTIGLDTEGEEDGFWRIGLGGSIKMFGSEATGSGRVGYDFYQSVHFTTSDYDLQSHRVHMTFLSPIYADLVELGITGVYDYYLLDFKSFYQQGRGTPWITVYEGDIAATQFYYSLVGQDFFDGPSDLRDPGPDPFNPFDPVRDAINNAVGLRQYFLLGAADRYMSIGYRWDDNDPLSSDGTDFAYMDNMFDVQLDFGIFGWAAGTVGYLVDLQDYEHPNSRTGFTKRRHDVQQNVVIHFQKPITSYLTAHLAYLGIFNHSNIPDFEYDRSIIQAGVGMHF